MQSIPAVPAFSQKAPLKRDPIDSKPKTKDGKFGSTDSQDESGRPASPFEPEKKKEKRKSPLRKTKEILNKSDTPIKPIKLEQEKLNRSADNIEDVTSNEAKEEVKEESTNEKGERKVTVVEDNRDGVKKDEAIETAGMFKSKSTRRMPAAGPSEVSTSSIYSYKYFYFCNFPPIIRQTFHPMRWKEGKC